MLVDQIFIQPYCRIGNLVDAGIGHRETASKYLKTLCDIGVSEEIKATLRLAGRACYVLPSNRSSLFSSSRFPCITATIRILVDSILYTKR